MQIDRKDQADSSGPSDEELLRQVCSEKHLPFELLIRLRDLEQRYSEMGRRHGIAAEMRDLVRQGLNDILEHRP